MDLIAIIAIIVFISKIMNKAGNAASQVEKYGKPQNVWDQVAGQVREGQNQARQTASNQNDQWKKLARENIEKAQRRAVEKLHEVERAIESEKEKSASYEMPKKNVRTTPAYDQITLQQVQASRTEARNTSILERATKNTDANKVDVTLTTMEAEHNHSERVSSATHVHPEDVIPENMLGNIEDLMIKGYDGNLCFERDFVGEAMDMISRFTV